MMKIFIPENRDHVIKGTDAAEVMVIANRIFNDSESLDNMYDQKIDIICAVESMFNEVAKHKYGEKKR